MLQRPAAPCGPPCPPPARGKALPEIREAPRAKLMALVTARLESAEEVELLARSLEAIERQTTAPRAPRGSGAVRGWFGPGCGCAGMLRSRA